MAEYGGGKIMNNEKPATAPSAPGENKSSESNLRAIKVQEAAKAASFAAEPRACPDCDCRPCACPQGETPTPVDIVNQAAAQAQANRATPAAPGADIETAPEHPGWICDECGKAVADDFEKAKCGTAYRHLPCGGKWRILWANPA